VLPRHRATAGTPVALLLLVSAGTLTACGVGMLGAAIVGWIDDGRHVVDMAAPGATTAAAGALGLIAVPRPDGSLIRPTVGFGAVALAWALAAVVGAVPLLLAGTFDSPLDALFEAMSGFTTTGATLLNDLDAQPDAVLLWRSITQWLGGVGIVLVVVAAAPLARIGFERAFYAEVTGITSDRLTPRLSDTAKIIAAIYLTLSAAAALAYLLAGMNLFDALNHAMTTLATGGFSTRTASIAAFDSVAVETVAVVFMILAGINFAIYWRVLRGQGARAQLAEAFVFLAILAAAAAAVIVSLELAADSSSLAGNARDAVFSVVSVATTTGFTTADFDAWDDFARLLLLALMVIGASAGSTGGGIKVIRAVLLGKTAWQMLQRQVQPRAVRVLRLGDRTFPEEVRMGLLGFLLVYAIVFSLGTIAFAICGLGPASALGATAATLNNIGPGIGDVGAIENFEVIPDGGKVVAILLMLSGRLEILTIFALLAALVGTLSRR
jgi:trk system potassium uptake protein TrkH